MDMSSLSFPNPAAEESAEELRAEIRAFLRSELAGRPARARAESWNGFDAAFSRKLGEQGWIGMTWPKRYGGRERSAMERYLVQEELLAAGAPVSAHWIADRQSGPLILRRGSEAQRREVLPKIARGECFFCIGLSEPNAGSDLAAVTTKAELTSEGFLVNGSKLWTTNGRHAHFMVLLCRTSAVTGRDRHHGLSQLLVNLSLPGISIRPIATLTGERHFDEVAFEDVLVPHEALIGEEGNGWQQVMSELAYERSGPERFLSSFILLNELVRVLGANPSERSAIAIGRLSSHLIVLRRLSQSVASMLESGQDPSIHAAIVKDLGARIEQETPEIARLLVATEPTFSQEESYAAVLGYTMLHAPSFSLRGGAREILRGIIARGLGLR